MAAEVGAGAVPKCHKAALLPFPSGTKGLLCLQPGRGNSVLPLGTPRSPSLARGRTLLSQGFWKDHSLPISCTRICTNTWAGALLRLITALSHEGRIPANPIPSPLSTTSSPPLLSTDKAWPQAA